MLFYSFSFTDISLLSASLLLSADYAVAGAGCSNHRREQLPAYVTGLIVHKALELYRGGNAEVAFATAVKEFAPGNLALQAQELFNNYINSDLYKQLPQKRERESAF